MSRRAFIVDIDGTMAIMGNRGPFEWDAVEGDFPNGPVVLLVQALSRAGIGVIFCSGRMEQARHGTARWLDTFFAMPYEALFMRADGDYRPDKVVKQEIYRREIEPRYDVIAVIDDRQQVVDMWRHELGLPCLQVAEGDF